MDTVLKAKNAAASSAAARRFQRMLFRHFKREVELVVAVLYFNLLGYLARLAVRSFDCVLALRQVRDFESAILAADRKVRIIHDGHIREHPAMHVALKAQETLRVGETQGDVWCTADLRYVFLFVARNSGSSMDVMNKRIGVLHSNLLAGLDCGNVRIIFATLLVNNKRRSGCASGLAGDVLDRNHH